MKPLISVVIPVFNEEQSILSLNGELEKALKKLDHPYEVVFIDDGSIDRSRKLVGDLCRIDEHVKAVFFKRNYGQTAAIAAGIDHAKGEYIVTMDADLQNDPADIPALIAKIDEGYDLVSGWRRWRKEPFFSRRLPSFLANQIISWMTGLKLHDYGCTLKAYRKDLIKNINLYGEMHRFIPLYVSGMGGRVIEMEVNHRQRKWGTSKYGIGRTFKVVLDLITVKFLLGNSSTSPLYFFGGWGLFLILSGCACGVVTLVQKFGWGLWVHRNPLLLLAVFLSILGTQVIFMGLLAELSIRIYYESTKRTIYTVKELINC